MKRKRKIKEAVKTVDPEFTIVFISGVNTVTRTIDSDTDMNQLYKDLEKEFVSDDFGIDSIWSDNFSFRGIDWTDILVDRGRLNEDLLEKIIDDPDIAYKMTFISNRGYDISEDRLDSIMVYEIGKEDLIKGNFGRRYPEDWLYESFSDNGLINNIIEKNWVYFIEGFARIMSDDEVSGSLLSSDIIGDYFVYTYDV